MGKQFVRSMSKQEAALLAARADQMRAGRQPPWIYDEPGFIKAFKEADTGKASFEMVHKGKVYIITRKPGKRIHYRLKNALAPCGTFLEERLR